MDDRKGKSIGSEKDVPKITDFFKSTSNKTCNEVSKPFCTVNDNLNPRVSEGKEIPAIECDVELAHNKRLAAEGDSQDSHNKCPKIRRKLREDWKIVPSNADATKDRKENLIIDPTDKWGMWCKCCTEISSTLGVSYLSNFVKDHPKFKPPDAKRQTVNLHFGSKSHKACFEKALTSGVKASDSVVYRSISRMSPEIQSKMEKLFRIVFAMVLEDRSATRFPFECQLQKLNGVALGKTYHNDFSFNTFLNYIDKDVCAKVISDISSASAIGILTDGSTTKANNEYEAICVRYVSTKSDVPCVKCILVGLGQIEHRANAEGLMVSICKTMDASGIENWKEKLVCCTSDGASVNVGHKAGLITKLAVPTNVHCYNHVFDLAVKETIKDSALATKIINLIRSISTFYRNSPKLYRELHATARALGEKLISFKPFCETRWSDSLETVARPIIYNYTSITAHLEQVISEHSDHKKDQKATAKGFLNELLNYENLYSLYAIEDFIAVAAKTSRKLEYAGILLNRAASLIKRTIKKIQEMQVKPSNCPLLTEFLHECIQGENSVGDQIFTFKGQILNQPKKRTASSGQHKNILPWEQVSKFYKAFQMNMTTRFPNDSPLLKAFQVLDGAFFPDKEEDLENYGIKEIKNLSEIFKLDSDLALHDWNELKDLIRTHFKGGTDYFRLLKMLQTKDIRHLNSLRFLLEALMCISPSNAEVERGWSGSKLLLGDHRLSMKYDTLEKRLRIKRNGGTLDLFNPVRSVELWWTSNLNKRHSRRPEYYDKDEESE